MSVGVGVGGGCKASPETQVGAETSSTAATESESSGVGSESSTSAVGSETSTGETSTGETDTGETDTGETDAGETTQDPPDETGESESESGESGESESGESETGSDTEEPDGPCADVCGTPGCGLCPDAPMIEGAGYRIDQTEVRVEDYAEFLAASILDEYLLPECTWKPDFGGFEAEAWPDQEAGDPDNPVTGVDWCDAETYCRWAGKRLCGSIGGGPPNYDDLETPSDEWYQACSGAGTSVYPYGDDYEGFACNGWELGVGEVVPVATLPACEGGLAELHDLSGNVWEWTAACAEPNPGLQDHELECRRRGGSWFTDDPDLLRCAVKSRRYRAFRASNVGIRCCADP